MRNIPKFVDAGTNTDVEAKVLFSKIKTNRGVLPVLNENYYSQIEDKYDTNKIFDSINTTKKDSLEGVFSTDIKSIVLEPPTSLKLEHRRSQSEYITPVKSKKTLLPPLSNKKIKKAVKKGLVLSKFSFSIIYGIFTETERQTMIPYKISNPSFWSKHEILWENVVRCKEVPDVLEKYLLPKNVKSAILVTVFKILNVKLNSQINIVFPLKPKMKHAFIKSKRLLQARWGLFNLGNTLGKSKKKALVRRIFAFSRIFLKDAETAYSYYLNFR